MGDISNGFRNGLWLVDLAMGKGDKLKVFWARSLQTSGCVWGCVLTKQSQSIDAVKSVICKKFLNGSTD